MIRRQPRSTRTDTRLPDATRFRSPRARPRGLRQAEEGRRPRQAPPDGAWDRPARRARRAPHERRHLQHHQRDRSAERRTGRSGRESPFRPPGLRALAQRESRFWQPAAPAEEPRRAPTAPGTRSEEHTSELQSLMRISYAVFCLKKKKNTNQNTNQTQKQ